MSVVLQGEKSWIQKTPGVIGGDACIRNTRIAVFNCRDFIRLHRQIRSHAGILACTRDDFAALAARIHQAILNCPSLDNQLLRITRPQAPPAPGGP